MQFTIVKCQHNLSAKISSTVIHQRAVFPVVDVINFFWRKSSFPKNLGIEKHLFWCQNLHKNVKTMLFLIMTMLKNSLLVFKWPILAVLANEEILIFQISSKKSFITSTTGWKFSSTTCKLYFHQPLILSWFDDWLIDPTSLLPLFLVTV